MFERIESWFARKGWTAFAFQREAWRAYLDGESGLVHAPTGTGKTYAVWLGPLIEAMSDSYDARAGSVGSHRGGMQVLWITPLRALAGDTAENLRAAAEALDVPWRIDIRTGDTSPSVRQRQRARPPHTLITTPESLSVLLSYPGASEQFRHLRCVIVDEWHELMGSKRGVQTELGLARLRALAPSLRTWGLSATLGNLDQAMRVLMGANHARGRMIRGDTPKQIVVETLMPENVERFPWSGHLGLRLLPQVLRAIAAARSTLLFTNVRSQAEIWFRSILKSQPDWIGEVALHHGSLDRAIRAKVEDLLRQGRLRCVVCTSSLDLGVDFTPVDQVMQVGSPKGIARMMQRAGRSGHQPGAESRIVGVPTNALELVEFAAAREATRLPSSPRRGLGRERSQDAFTSAPSERESEKALEVESRTPMDRPLDVLVQHLVTLASGDGFRADALRTEVRSTHAYRALSDREWQWALDFVAQGGPTLHAYPQFARVREDGGRWIVAGKHIERLHRMSIGTITSDAAVRVAFANGRTLGTIEESFISRLNLGDRFVFGGRVLELLRLRDMTAHVRPAKSTSGLVPRWMGGRSPLSTLLSRAIRRKLNQARLGEFDSVEMEKARPLLELQSRWSIIPAPSELLIERTRTRDGHHWFIFPFEGRSVHEGLSSLIAHRITRRGPCSMHVTANDYGFELLSLQPIEISHDDWRGLFSTDGLIEDLLGCLNTTALARRAFRDIARVAGLIFPGFPGTRQSKSVRQLQASSNLFYEVFREFDPENLLLDQARREVLDRELEVSRLRDTLGRINGAAIRIIDTRSLTPLSFPLWAESIRTQHMSSERWTDRVQRMIVQLERDASESGAQAPRTPRKSNQRSVAKAS